MVFALNVLLFASCNDEIHQQMIPHIEQQAREEARKAVLTERLMDQVIVGGPSIIGQDEVYVLFNLMNLVYHLYFDM